MPTLLNKVLAVLFWASLGIGCGAQPKAVAKPTPPKADCSKPAPAKKVDPASAYLDIESCPAGETSTSQPRRDH